MHCEPTSHACVQCLADDQCDSPSAAHCGTDHTCGDCTADDQCTRLTATPVCDEAGGSCVECTGDTEAAQCGANSCRRSDGTCTSTPRGTRDSCDSCEADSECVTGRACVHHIFMGTDTGSFCFLDAAGGCGDTDMTLRPFSTRTMLTSIDGATSTYCMPPVSTTCQGIADTRSMSCTTSDMCGVAGLDDAICPTTGAGANLCNYACGGNVDCRMSLTCQGSPSRCAP